MWPRSVRGYLGAFLAIAKLPGGWRARGAGGGAMPLAFVSNLNVNVALFNFYLNII